MVALKLRQFQYNLKKVFLRRLVFRMPFCHSEGSPHRGGGIARGGYKGGAILQDKILPTRLRIRPTSFMICPTSLRNCPKCHKPRLSVLEIGPTCCLQIRPMRLQIHPTCPEIRATGGAGPGPVVTQLPPLSVCGALGLPCSVLGCGVSFGGGRFLHSSCAGGLSGLGSAQGFAIHGQLALCGGSGLRPEGLLFFWTALVRLPQARHTAGPGTPAQCNPLLPLPQQRSWGMVLGVGQCATVCPE